MTIRSALFRRRPTRAALALAITAQALLVAGVAASDPAGSPRFDPHQPPPLAPGVLQAASHRPDAVSRFLVFFDPEAVAPTPGGRAVLDLVMDSGGTGRPITLLARLPAAPAAADRVRARMRGLRTTLVRAGHRVTTLASRSRIGRSDWLPDAVELVLAPTEPARPFRGASVRQSDGPAAAGL